MKKIVIIGGGAAGYFVAANIPGINLKIHILEKSSKILSKVRISGGGRCNVTHNCYDNIELSENYPRGSKELRGVFSRFGVKDTIDWFETKGVKIKTEVDGRMFPATDDSFSIVNCLVKEAEKNGALLKMNAEVTDIKKVNPGFTVYLKSGETIDSHYVVITSGGISRTEGYSFLKSLGMVIIPPVPSLFTFNLPRNNITGLMGISVEEARVKVIGAKLEETGPLLITHWGFSGPVILRLSAWGAKHLNELGYNFRISVGWLSDRKRVDRELERLSLEKKQFVCNSTFPGIPQRLWKYLINKASIPDNLQWANMSNKNFNTLKEVLCNDIYDIKGKTTFKEEFVTCGGVDLKEIDLTTMQSRKHPGLFFAGEVLNVDGITGGFNFQHAWASAFIAAKTIEKQATI